MAPIAPSILAKSPLPQPGERPRAGVFVKTPAIEIVELLALGGVDFICLDAEHAPFDRLTLDRMIAMARALSLPCLVRVAAACPEAIMQAFDMGAGGVVVPHVAGVEMAKDVARWAHFGHGGRGYAGSTRAAGYTTQGMAATLAEAREGRIVIAQIEEPEGVAEAEAIAAVDGIDAIFFGAADLAVAKGLVNSDDPALADALHIVSRAVASAGKPLAGFVSSADKLGEAHAKGISMAFVGSEQSIILAGARGLARSAAALSTEHAA
ncbi:HpcH/HpaI aldolase family protein [Bradyrhizobium liaoningense]